MNGTNEISMNIWPIAFHIFIYQIMKIWSPRIKKKILSGNLFLLNGFKRSRHDIGGIQIYVIIIFLLNLKPWLLHSLNT
jgi:hypothetical protein